MIDLDISFYFILITIMNEYYDSLVNGASEEDLAEAAQAALAASLLGGNVKKVEIEGIPCWVVDSD